jgi:photosystem II CP47 chlorophyll apoprotein
MWFGAVCYPLELLGPSRYHWDNGYFTNYIDRRSSISYTSGVVVSSFCSIPDKLVVYDYIGSNPAKGGLFRSGPMIKGDGIVQNWLGHATFELGSLPLSTRRMPSFFETFPVLLLDRAGTVRSDIPFRRSEARFSFEQSNVLVYFQGGVLDGAEYSTPTVVKNYARKSQLGEILSFDCKTPLSEGVLRSSSRAWYSFTHLTFSLIFIFGHLWHSGRSILI